MMTLFNNHDATVRYNWFEDGMGTGWVTHYDGSKQSHVCVWQRILLQYRIYRWSW